MYSAVMLIFNMLIVVMLSIMTPFVSKIKAAVSKIAFALLKLCEGGGGILKVKKSKFVTVS